MRLIANKMNIRTAYVLIGILATAGTISVSPAFALQQPCPDCPGTGDVIPSMKQPVNIWTDKTVYDHESTIMINGEVTNLKGQPVTIRVTSPIGNIISIGQIDLGSSTTFSTTFNTAGPLWKYDGTYRIQAFYGAQEVNDKVLIELTGSGLELAPVPSCTGPGEYMENGVCIPEFGTVAVMILAVSIVAIIAVSARSKLSILPKY